MLQMWRTAADRSNSIEAVKARASFAFLGTFAMMLCFMADMLLVGVPSMTMVWRVPVVAFAFAANLLAYAMFDRATNTARVGVRRTVAAIYLFNCLIMSAQMVYNPSTLDDVFKLVWAGLFYWAAHTLNRPPV